MKKQAGTSPAVPACAYMPQQRLLLPGVTMDRDSLSRCRHLPACVTFAALVSIASASLSAAEPDKITPADRLFQQKQWKQAGAAYEGILRQSDDPRCPSSRIALRRAVSCRLALGDREHASQLLRQAIVLDADAFERSEHDATGEQIELIRELLAELAASIPIKKNPAPSDLYWRVSMERIDADFQLIDQLIGDPIAGEGRGTTLEEWWQEKRPTRLPSPGERVLEVPLDAKGHPAFLEPPAHDSPDLGLGKKILFLLSEIGKLDPTRDRIHAARAMLMRAVICQWLYAPLTTPDFTDGSAGLDPMVEARRGNIRPPWTLTDTESVFLVEDRMEVISLPDPHNPLALLRRLENDFPRTNWAAEACYRRATYYQSRQQFSEALKVFRRLLDTYPQHPLAENAGTQIRRIEHADVILGMTGAYPAGSNAEVEFAYRNTDQVSFTARRFDLARFLTELTRRKGASPWSCSSYGVAEIPEVIVRPDERDDSLAKRKRFDRCLEDTAVAWSQSVPKGTLAQTGKTRLPFTEPGAYIVEAGPAKGPATARALVVITDIAIVVKALPTKSLIYVANSVTGQPLPGQQLRVFQQAPGNPRMTETRLTTDAFGVLERPPGSERLFAVLALSPKGGAACAIGMGGRFADERVETRVYGVTGRPAYRPGSSVHFRLWVRELAARKYQPISAGQPVEVVIHDPRDTTKHLSLRADQEGSVCGNFTVPFEARLGEYTISVSRGNDLRACSFRVEEYKKPEFEATVTVGSEVARLGAKVKARVRARYYFGTPVAGARVRYHVRRFETVVDSHVPRAYDWLYGAGYGRYQPSYPWISSSAKKAEDEAAAESVDDQRGRARTICRGEVVLDKDGSGEIEIDTGEAASGSASCYGYAVEVNVRDDSLRTVYADGQFTVARDAYAATVECDRGWCRPGEECAFDVFTRTPDGEGAAAAGTLTLTRARYAGTGHERVQQEALQSWAVHTDRSGRARVQVRVPDEGEYRVEFRGRDLPGKDVLADCVFWVHGSHFDGRRYRFAGLEIIPDHRTYRIGDTAHLLIHTARFAARVLFSDKASGRHLENYRFLDIAGHAQVVDVPITGECVPNRFVEGTVVADGEVFNEACELLVPPVHQVLNVNIQTDKRGYHPGEKGNARVTVTDVDGRPAQGTVALSIFDKALLPIQQEAAEGPQEQLLSAPMDQHERDLDVSLGWHQLPSTGSFECPQVLAANFDQRFALSGGFGGLGGTAGLAPAQGRSWMNSGLGGMMGGGGALGALGISGGGGGFIGSSMQAAPAPSATGRGFFGSHGFGRVAPEPVLRSNFADSGLWIAKLPLSADGTAQTPFTLPESLTTWRLHAWVVTAATEAGDGVCDVTASKQLLVRLEAPRFVVESDEVVLSAMVHNDFPRDKDVTAELLVPAALFECLDKRAGPPAVEPGGKLRLRRTGIVPAHGGQRFDWCVRALSHGRAELAARALSDEESDAAQLIVPILGHGVTRNRAGCGRFAEDEHGQQNLKLTVPALVDPSQTRLEFAISSSPVGPMLEALPFLAGYPYGCTEQTMSRFYPTILAAQTLQKLGIHLAKLRQARKGTTALPEPPAVYDPEELRRMAEAGLHRLEAFQHSDGGWGWWPHDESSPFMTAYVLIGLHAADQAKYPVSQEMYANAMNYLAKRAASESNEAAITDDAGRQTEAYVAYALSLSYPKWLLGRTGYQSTPTQSVTRQYLEQLFPRRARLNAYGKALLALALANSGNQRDARTVLGELVGQVESNHALATAWLPTPRDHWWFWWNNDIETNAWLLKAMVAIEPNHTAAPCIAQWLVGHRAGGQYWRSTRDTALAVSALADYAVSRPTHDSDCQVVVSIDRKTVGNFPDATQGLALNQALIVEGSILGAGAHEVVLTKSGPGELFYSWSLTYFSKEQPIRPERHQLGIQREYFKILEDGRRQQVNDGDTVPAGEKMEIVLTVTAEKECDYVALEDPKPAGCEPVRFGSGELSEQASATAEFRDNRVVLFVPYLTAGAHVFRYQIRTEVPGVFHALPASAFAMYAPEISGRSGETLLRISER